MRTVFGEYLVDETGVVPSTEHTTVSLTRWGRICAAYGARPGGPGANMVVAGNAAARALGFGNCLVGVSTYQKALFGIETPYCAPRAVRYGLLGALVAALGVWGFGMWRNGGFERQVYPVTQVEFALSPASESALSAAGITAERKDVDVRPSAHNNIRLTTVSQYRHLTVSSRTGYYGFGNGVGPGTFYSNDRFGDVIESRSTLIEYESLANAMELPRSRDPAEVARALACTTQRWGNERTVNKSAGNHYRTGPATLEAASHMINAAAAKLVTLNSIRPPRPSFMALWWEKMSQ